MEQVDFRAVVSDRPPSVDICYEPSPSMLRAAAGQLWSGGVILCLVAWLSISYSELIRLQLVDPTRPARNDVRPYWKSSSEGDSVSDMLRTVTLRLLEFSGHAERSVMQTAAVSLVFSALQWRHRNWTLCQIVEDTRDTITETGHQPRSWDPCPCDHLPTACVPKVSAYQTSLSKTPTMTDV